MIFAAALETLRLAFPPLVEVTPAVRDVLGTSSAWGEGAIFWGEIFGLWGLGERLLATFRD